VKQKKRNVLEYRYYSSPLNDNITVTLYSVERERTRQKKIKGHTTLQRDYQKISEKRQVQKKAKKRPKARKQNRRQTKKRRRK